jgi:hypothetical protein
VQHGQVVGREAADQPGRVLVAVGQGDLEAAGPWTTWALVTTSPPASKTMPEPRPWLVWIRTTEGPTCLTTWTNCCWRARADGATCAAGVAADELVALAVVAEQPARTSSATNAATAGRSRRGPPPMPGRGLRMRSRIILVPFLR